ncbi:MAG TPA: adenylate/guanylate cyclase domain-containing protein [Kofleriaceae bacterium]|jgi:adenylate cyclase|nr:adenylate/guanylate cyclase domain-containing protein [Kofleriaceae bacterium]
MARSGIAELGAWLLGAAHVDDGGLALMTELVARLRTHGVPLWRCSFSLMTKHPELVWRTVQWNEVDGVTAVERSRAQLDAPYFQRSPIAVLRRGGAPIRVALGDGALPYPICDDLRAQGGTEYVAQGLPGSTGEISYISWATRAPGGFGDATVAALIALTPYLASRIELAAAYHSTRALLEVYLGRNAGRRVAEGAFRRGTGERIEAAIWFCDLRGFTRLSDDRTPEAVVETLDRYFDCVAGVVMAAGGEVLKFIGDAILAIFPVAAFGGEAAAACRQALAAADQAFAALAQVNHERTAHGEPALAFGVALHLGQVMYGNIGARDRLDFTVISSSVNEASRLESLCKTLGTPLALSQAFVDAARPDDLVDLGPQQLKGVRAPIRVFTLGRHVER